MRSSLPDRMQVVEILRPGGPEVLNIATRPLPGLKAGEVLIRVAAAGVNRPDCFQPRRSLPATVGPLRPAGARGRRNCGRVCGRREAMETG